MQHWSNGDAADPSAAGDAPSHLKHGVPHIRLEDFHISPLTGFVIEDPLTELPEYFSVWNDMATQMSELVGRHELRDRVNQMPLLDHMHLKGHREKRLAHLQLCMIGAGYVWQEGDQGVCKSVPPCLAIPWCGVSEQLGLQPIISHPALLLANSIRINRNGPLTLDNVACIYHLPPGRQGDPFIQITTLIEYDFSTAINHIISGYNSAHLSDIAALMTSLCGVEQTMGKMKQTFSDMHKFLHADLFYNEMRPFLSGWGGSSSPLPDGLVYEGVSDTPVKLVGGSAAQSSSLQSADAFLGINHGPEVAGFLHKMRTYMPPAHRAFIETLEKHSTVLQLVTESSDESLKKCYNDCVAAVRDFRSYHITVVTKYIVVMANKANRNRNYEGVSKTGTGGTSILPFLKNIRSTTADQSSSIP